jgi:hypothetical protein
MKIRLRLRVILYVVSSALFLTGVIWELFDRFVKVSTPIGDMKHPAEAWVLRAHGAAALVSVFIAGHLYASHIRPAWRSRRKRGSGLTLCSVIVALILSGYLLYYAGGDEFRDLVANAHLWIGVAAPLPFCWHIFWHLFRKSRRVV